MPRLPLPLPRRSRLTLRQKYRLPPFKDVLLPLDCGVLHEAQAPYVFVGASGSTTAATPGDPSTNPGGPNIPPAQQKYRWAPLYQPNPPEPERADTPESLIHPNDYSSFNFS